MRSFQTRAASLASLFLGSVSLQAAEPELGDPGNPGDLLMGYPEEEEMVGSPNDAEEIIDSSFSQPGALLPWLTVPGGDDYQEFKKQLYAEYGLKYAISYQQLYQHASDTLPGAAYDSALGGWFMMNAAWTPINRDEDFEGTLVAQVGWRDSIGNNAVPAQFGIRDLGSLWSNYEFTSWGGGLHVEDLYWEQWLRKGRFSFRVGNMIATSVYNFFRCKDARSSFTASPFAFHETISVPTYGLGGSFKWWPVEGSEFYVVGTLNDMNGDPNNQGLDWSTFDRGEYFYGLEFGYFWRREGGEFDHLHLDVFAADERSTRSPNTLPNESGGGFRIAGEKQMGRLVAFGGYTYNTIEGGGFAATLSRQTGTAGLIYLSPFEIRGEAALGVMWSQSIPNVFPGVGREDQYGFETYWKILLTPNTWVTPGVQVIFDPALNPVEDVIVIPHVKFSATF